MAALVVQNSAPTSLVVVVDVSPRMFSKKRSMDSCSQAEFLTLGQAAATARNAAFGNLSVDSCSQAEFLTIGQAAATA